MIYLIMARIEVEDIWPTVCYTCPARIPTPDGPACDERNIGRPKSNGSVKNRPLFCPNGNSQDDENNIENILRNNGRK
jgi:hypothetical protein